MPARFRIGPVLNDDEVEDRYCGRSEWTRRQKRPLTIGTETRTYGDWIARSTIRTTTVLGRVKRGLLEVQSLITLNPSRRDYGLHLSGADLPWLRTVQLTNGQWRVFLNDGESDCVKYGIEALHSLMFGEGLCTLETVLAELTESHRARLLELRVSIADCLHQWEAGDKTSELVMEVTEDELNLMEEVILRRHSRVIPKPAQAAGEIAAPTTNEAKEEHNTLVDKVNAAEDLTAITCDQQEATAEEDDDALCVNEDDQGKREERETNVNDDTAETEEHVNEGYAEATANLDSDDAEVTLPATV